MKLKRKLAFISYILALSIALSGCTHLSKANSKNLTEKLLNQSIKDGATAGAKKSKIIAKWTSKVLDSDKEKLGVDYYSYFEFDNKITLKIPNNKFFVEVYVGSKVNNPSPNEYYISSFDSSYKLHYKEYVKNKYFYYLILYDTTEIKFDDDIEDIEFSYNLDWLVNKNVTDDSDIMQKYINIKLFESYYRANIVNKLIVDPYYTISYDDILGFRSKLVEGDYDMSIESFLLHSYMGESKFYDWIDAVGDRDIPIRTLIKNLIESHNVAGKRKEIEEYIQNISIEEKVPIFNNNEIFFSFDFLDREIGIPKISIEKMQKIDAYNIFES